MTTPNVVNSRCVVVVAGHFWTVMEARPQTVRDTGAFGVQAHLFGDLRSHTGRFGGENRRLGGRWRHPVTNSDVLRIEGHGVKAPIAPAPPPD